MNFKKSIDNYTKKLESFFKKKKDIFLIGFWFANLYLFTRTFGGYFEQQFGTILAIAGTISVYVLKKWIYFYIKKYGILKVFSTIGIITFMHLIISMYVIKPLKPKTIK